MSKIEIIVMLFTIVYGLMLTDLFASFHKLLRVRKIVKWHWLPLLAVWFLFLMIIKNWWSLDTQQGSSIINFFSFIARSHLLFLLYLLVSTSLPDEIPNEGLDLKDYYFQNRKYFWGLMALVNLLSMTIYLTPVLINDLPISLQMIIANIVITLLFILLMKTKKYWIHSTLLILFFMVQLLEIAQSF